MQKNNLNKDKSTIRLPNILLFITQNLEGKHLPFTTLVVPTNKPKSNIYFRLLDDYMDLTQKPSSFFIWWVVDLLRAKQYSYVGSNWLFSSTWAELSFVVFELNYFTKRA